MASLDPEDVPSSPETDIEQDSSMMAEEKYKRESTEEKTPDRASNGTKPSAKSNAKDPSRPRRKKARRACFNCQRAHLTCGDERPCNRCIKRGLHEQCHDGVRKKAKYLHDAPAEALIPRYHGNYTVNGAQTVSADHNAVGSSAQPVDYYATAPSSFPQYDTSAQPAHINQQMIDNSGVATGASHVPMMSSPTRYQQPVSQDVSPVHDLPSDFAQSSALGSINNPTFEGAMIDPSDPHLFNANFNAADYNFDNTYGALEFGMLGHMTSGAVNTPEMEMQDTMNHPGSFSYDVTTGMPMPAFPYTQSFQPWQNAGPRQGSTTNLWALHHNGTDAYAVADSMGSITEASPQSQNQEWTGAYPSSTVSPEAPFVQLNQSRPKQSHSHRQRQSAPFPIDFGPVMTRKARRRDTKQIYASVTKPYPYTQRFHSLTAFLEKRFPSDKRLRIAKAMEKIRPSFIDHTKDLSEDDLIFIEQGLQRQLVDTDDTLAQIGTPSIICRRTGEVICCNKEFSLVTGWRRDVLLGKEPNLNVNFGSNTSGTHTGSSTRGAVTPRVPTTESDTTLPQPVFLAELLDQESAVGFWEDFAECAFGASTSSMPGVTCSLIKYKTKDEPGWKPEDRLADGARRKATVEGNGASALGERDGMIDMSMTWLVRRDMFAIPMMIVINFLPMI